MSKLEELESQWKAEKYFFFQSIRFYEVVFKTLNHPTLAFKIETGRGQLKEKLVVSSWL